IGTVECCVFGNLTSEKTFSEWAKGNETDAQFLEGWQNFLFWFSPPERVLALQCGYWLHSVCATNRLYSRFRKTEVFDLTCFNKILNCSSHFFDRYFRINSML